MPEYDAGTVKATMVADSKGLHGGVEAAKKDMQSLQDEAKRVKEAWRDMGLGAGVSFAAITAGILKATQANNQLKASMMGMDSIAKGTVGTYSKIEAELKKIKDDGMIPLTNAIAAYKNLLMRYEDEETAIKMFHRLADAAAFGRQGQLSLGEAIQGATEGLKNEMSQMVDNAGVTKNLSVMHKEYAASIGKTVGQLTLAEKRQAEINGIMKETRHQVGDLAKLQNSLSGELAKANAETNQAAAAFGDALEPALTGAVGSFSGLMKGIREFIQSAPGLTAGITTGALAMSGLVAVSSAWIALDMGAKIAAGFSALTGPVGLTMIGLSALTAVIVGLNTEMAKAKEYQAKLADSYRDQASEAEELITEYETLTKKVNKTAEEKERLRKVTNDISRILPQAVKGYDDEGNAIIDVNAALKEMIILKGQEFKLREDIIRKEIADDSRRKKRLQDRKTELQDHLNLVRNAIRSTHGIDFLNMSDDDIESITDERVKSRIKNVLSQYYAGVREINEQISDIDQRIGFKEDQIKYIDDLLSGKITRQTIRDGKTTSTTPPETSINQEVIASADELNKLQERLMIERLNRQKRFREAEINEERARYAEELQLAGDNAGLREQVEQAHIDRMNAIDEKYSEQERQRNKELTDEIIRMTGTKEEQEELYIRRHAEQMERDGYNFQQIEDWKAAYHKQKTDEMKRNQADLVSDLVLRKTTIEDVWKQMCDEIVRQWIYAMMGVKSETGQATKFFDALLGGGNNGGGFFSGIGNWLSKIFSFSGGGIVPAASRGMLVPAAASGMVVPPSFGTDTVLSALTPKEMVLPVDISEGLQNLIKQGSQPQIVNNNITNNYIDAIDQQSVAQFFYKNRDHVVGIIQDNQRRGGVLRQSEE